MPSVRAAKLQAASSVDAATLRALAAHESRSVRIAVAGNAATDDPTIRRLLVDDADVVRLAAAGALRDRPQSVFARSASEGRMRTPSRRGVRAGGG